MMNGKPETTRSNTPSPCRDAASPTLSPAHPALVLEALASPLQHRFGAVDGDDQLYRRSALENQSRQTAVAAPEVKDPPWRRREEVGQDLLAHSI